MTTLHPILSAISVTCGEINACPNKAKTITDGLAGVVEAMIFLVGALALVFLIVSGLQMTLSVGDPKRYQQGRDGLRNSIIGIVLALFAFSIVKFITSAI